MKKSMTLAELITILLRKRITIIIISLIFSILLGAYSLYTGSNAGVEENILEDEKTGLSEAYYENGIQIVQGYILGLEKAMYNDVFLREASNTLQKKNIQYAVVFPESNMQTEPDRVALRKDILAFYESSLQQNGAYVVFSEDTNVDELYIDNMYSIGVVRDVLLNTSAYISNIIDADMVLENIAEQLAVLKVQATKVFGEHELLEISRNTQDMHNTYAYQIYMDYVNKINSSNVKLEEITQEYEEFMEIENITVNETVSLRNILKYVFVGFVIGFFLGIALVICKEFIMGSKINVVDKVTDLQGVAYLGGVRPSKKKAKIDQAIDRFAGLDVPNDDIAMLCAKLTDMCMVGSSVLFTGSIDIEVIKRLAEKVESSITDKKLIVLYGEDIRHSAVSYEKAKSADVFVLVESIDKTPMKTVERETVQLSEKGNNAKIGIVLL